ncbi:MAG: nitronate monooxygenase [Gaiellaceae bacterium]|nr:nitronate monooxygenase [Gaiellaceae bacterium]
MTSFTALVGCKLPVQLAGLGAFGVGAAPAVTRAGGLGTVVATRFDAHQCDETFGALPQPVVANFTRPQDGNKEAIAAAARHARVIEFFWAEPRHDFVRIAHEAGALATWQCGSIPEARSAIEAGCDYVTLQGVEAGGHVRGKTPVRELVAAGAEVFEVPIVAAGGIATAEAVEELLELGAAGVRVGTRFLAARETRAHPRYVELLLAARAGDTVMTEAFEVGWRDAPHRVLRSALDASHAFTGDSTGERGGAEVPHWSAAPPHEETTGDIDAMALYAGMGVGSVTRVEPAADILAELCSLL